MSSGFQKCHTLMITGANRGLGLQMVKALVNSSHCPRKVIATTRDKSRAKELLDLAKKYPCINVVTLDAINQDSIEQASKEVESLLGDEGLNCLINNAGINISGTLETVEAEQMMKNYETNAVSPLMITKAFLPLLKKAAKQGTGMGIHRAAVVNVSSLLGSIELNWGPGAEFKTYPYRASKAALNMLTRCVAVDLTPEGILCMAVHPGWVQTDMGGPDALLSKEESINGVLSVIGSLSEKNNGGFLDYTGQTLPW
ncbi:C-signal [Acipenser ruthenus]|uniref:C-signal n=1 Tax=Acipenser ruthenus TaxID=7906 RepID=UPI002741FA80|nr:C-signal [Acipenser ruthenus]